MINSNEMRKKYVLTYVDGSWVIREELAATATCSFVRDLSKGFTKKAWALRWASNHLPHIVVKRYYNSFTRAIRARLAYECTYGKCILDSIPEGDGESGFYTYRIEFEHKPAPKPRFKSSTNTENQ